MGSMMHPTDWEHQREQLSAYLDGELSAAERAALERHLPACSECRAELAELRRVRALLGALPSPSLPRSFALPTSGGIRPRPPITASREPAQPNRPAWYRASQWVGSIAASIGLLLLLGNAVLGGHSGSGYGTLSSSSAPRIETSKSTGTADQAQQTPAAPTGPEATNTPTATDRIGASPTPAPTPTPFSESPPSGQEPPLLPLTGVGLLTGGVALLVIGRVARRR